NGTTLATHSPGATIFAYRLLTIARAQYGTTASTYSNGAAVYRHRVPALIRDLCAAEADVQVINEGAGYARTVGAGEAAFPAPGADLASKWDEAVTAFGRKARQRVI